MRAVKLDYPLEVEGQETITELNFGRIKMKHVRNLPESIFEGGIKPSEFSLVIAVLADIPEEYADEIDAAEIDKIMDAINPLLEEFQQTGKT